MPTSAHHGMDEMCLNILVEAEEKCEEIDVKCEDEYNDLRWKEIKNRTDNIEKDANKKLNGILKDDRVYYTKLLNNSRLAKLKAKHDIVKKIKEETKKRLREDTGPRYKKLMENTLVEAAYLLMEKEVKVICKKSDQSLVTSCFPKVAATFNQATNLNMKMSIDQRTSLSSKGIGGAMLSTVDGTISVNCQLETRVEEVCMQAMPLITQMLFGDTPKEKSTAKALNPLTVKSCPEPSTESGKNIFCRLNN